MKPRRPHNIHPETNHGSNHGTSPKANNESGAVLLTTLLIMAIMAALAVTLMDDIRYALKRTGNMSDYAQADWYVRGAEDYVADVLGARLGQVSDAAARNEIVRNISPLTLPIDQGIMSLIIRDGSHCFNVNSLVDTNGLIVTAAKTRFTDTLDAVGIPASEAERLAATLIDWIDRDSQPLSGGAEDGNYLRRNPALLPANSPIASIMEIRTIEGMTTELYDALRPWLCVGDVGSPHKFNINLAEAWQAPLLAGRLGGADKLPLAIQLISERPPEGYSNLNDNPLIKAHLQTNNENPTSLETLIGYKPESLWVELTLNYRKAQRTRSFHFTGLDNNALRLTYRGWGYESFRPYMRPEQHSDEGGRL